MHVSSFSAVRLPMDLDKSVQGTSSDFEAIKIVLYIILFVLVFFYEFRRRNPGGL